MESHVNWFICAGDDQLQSVEYILREHIDNGNNISSIIQLMSTKFVLCRRRLGIECNALFSALGQVVIEFAVTCFVGMVDFGAFVTVVANTHTHALWAMLL